MRFKSDEALMSWKKKDSSDIVVAIVSIKLESTVEYYPRSSAFTMIAIIDIVSPKNVVLFLLSNHKEDKDSLLKQLVSWAKPQLCTYITLFSIFLESLKGRRFIF